MECSGRKRLAHERTPASLVLSRKKCNLSRGPNVSLYVILNSPVCTCIQQALNFYILMTGASPFFVTLGSLMPFSGFSCVLGRIAR